jgi:membrane protein YdbS with pleckstrin-like domain
MKTILKIIALLLTVSVVAIVSTYFVHVAGPIPFLVLFFIAFFVATYVTLRE